MSVQKINLKETIEWLVVEFKSIDSQDIPQHKKTRLFQALASKFVTKLYNDGRRTAQQKITLKTARGYLTKARKAIREITGIHHRFEAELSRLSKKYSRSTYFLTKLSGLTNTEEAGNVKSGLLKELSFASEIRASVESLDFSKRTINNKVNKLADKYPAYAHYINNLVVGDSVIAAKTELFKAINEAKPLYSELKSLKVDHELYVNLTIPDADAEFFKADKETRLIRKKNTVVFVDYPRYMQQITTILENPTAYFNGIVSGIAPLLFALCAASGRRSIEIFLLGDFVAKDTHNLVFTGQAKKREDDSAERTIYSLVDTRTFLIALAVLRNHALTKKIIAESESRDHYSTNEIIKGKISSHLNDFAKNFFIDKKRVSKDVRGIYGRICYQEWYLTDPRWRSKDEDIFFFELFGHSDTDAQTHYKPYKLNNYVANYKAEALENTRWQALCELDEDMSGLARGNAAIDIHDWVKTAVEQNPNAEINQSILVRETKKFRGTIKNYLDAIGDLALPGEPITNQSDEELVDTPNEKTAGVNNDKAETKVIVKQKPRIKINDLGDDNWTVTIGLGERTATFNLRAGDKMTAMKTGYDLFTGDLFEFEVTIPYKEGPHFQEVVYAGNANEAKRFAVNYAFLDGFKGPCNKIQVKQL